MKLNLPGPNLRDSPSHIEVDDLKIKIAARSTYPEIVVMENILDQDECCSLIDMASQRLERSRVADGSPHGYVDERRTSHGVFLSGDSCKLVSKLDERIAKLLNWPIEQMEDLQILRYKAGEQYMPHYDFFDAASRKAPANRAQRIATLVIYLKEADCGGGTIFPMMPLEIFPRRGSGIFFVYPNPDTHQSKRTLHGGSPVITGSKWVATKWLTVGKSEESEANVSNSPYWQ
ncbi:2OG-Fe(II) oxygenase [Pandoraea fibrosis]|uniref:Fe2OG dioxygenase domain-containing protein n=1 Tax=Pandoraea fibrosis TaxID=1891094 RepID=A0A5E4Y4F0_9BURK|nr:2OG-Fe(II) oxygenase [Pandoraea fibrosis]VVE43212.1 hypothetical protein PFI31113_04239 [Pandoraea fibrosis]